MAKAGSQSLSRDPRLNLNFCIQNLDFIAAVARRPT
eukprot:COSAG05_NODE_15663_length_364_cov_0.784906_1_plen_35_part_10